ncbi:MAG: MFS transporter [Thermoplasmata archaeon]
MPPTVESAATRPPAASSGRTLAFTSLGHFVNDGTTFFVPVLAALLTARRGFSPLEITTLFVLFYAAASLLSPWIGHRADRSENLPLLMAAGLGLLGAGLIGFYASLNGLEGPPALLVAMVSAFVVGFGTAFYHPIGATLLQRAFDPARRGRALGVNGAFGSLGRTLYPFFFAALTLLLFPDASLLVFIVLGWASALVIWGVAGRPAAPPERLATREAAPGARRAVTRGIVLLTGVAFLRSIATQGIVAWIPTYLSTQRGAGVGADLGFAVTLMFVGGILGQPVFGLLADRVDQRLLLAVSGAGSGLATLGYLGTAGAAATVLLFLIGFFTFSAFPILMSLSAGFVDRRSASLGNALVFGLGAGGGGAVGPLIIGWIAAGGYSALPIGFEVMVAIALVSAAATVVIPAPGAAGRLGRFG